LLTIASFGLLFSVTRIELMILATSISVFVRVVINLESDKKEKTLHSESC
ncbi:1258_t:CDS:1, partial [Dentiscutata heterogama]